MNWDFVKAENQSTIDGSEVHVLLGTLKGQEMLL